MCIQVRIGYVQYRCECTDNKKDCDDDDDIRLIVGLSVGLGGALLIIVIIFTIYCCVQKHKDASRPFKSERLSQQSSYSGSYMKGVTMNDYSITEGDAQKL